MISLLDLPREIRELIFEYIFHSPAPSNRALVSLLPNPRLQRSKAASSSSTTNKSHTSFILITNPIQAFSGNRHEPATVIETTLSISHVCRQIYDETHGRFWAENTLYFPRYPYASRFQHMSKSLLGLYPTLKAMGQTASRLITHIRIDMSTPTRHMMKYDDLSRVLSTLASRARHGNFKHLELSWDHMTIFQFLMQGHSPQRSPLSVGYTDLLQILENGTDACRYERVIEFPSLERLLESIITWDTDDERVEKLDQLDGMAIEMHTAFGGKLFWGDELGWDKGVCKLSVLHKYRTIDV